MQTCVIKNCSRYLSTKPVYYFVSNLFVLFVLFPLIYVYFCKEMLLICCNKLFNIKLELFNFIFITTINCYIKNVTLNNYKESNIMYKKCEN